MRIAVTLATILAAVLALSACGGSQEDPASPSGASVRALQARPLAASETAANDVEALFDWAERTYPQFFPGPQRTQDLPPYRYRAYPGTGNHVGVADGTVYILGPVSGGALQAVGSVTRFECEVQPEKCLAGVPAFEARYDIQDNAIRGGAVLAKDSGGRHLAWGASRAVAATIGAPVAGSGARVIADEQFLQMVVGPDYYGALLRRDGSVAEWGVFGFATPTPTAPLSVSLPGPVAQLGLGRYLHALLRDGSVWVQSSELANIDGALRRRMVRLQAPPDLVAFSSGQFQQDVLAVSRSGEVWQLPATKKAGLADVASVHCTRSHCLAVHRSGGLTWWDSTGAAPRPLPPFDKVVLKQAVFYGDSTPVAVFAVGAEGQLYVWSFFGGVLQTSSLGLVSDVSCTMQFCAVKRRDGSVWGWGSELGALYPADPRGSVGTALAPVRLTSVNVP